jgi:AcrR family transcriptional regulator
MKKDTKERILDSALSLFNSENIDHVTIRDVAKKAGISHGNLCYHFPNIESLVENLYKRLVMEMDEQFREMTGQEISFAILHASSAATFRKMYAYKFLMLDFVRVMRKSKRIRQHYQQLYRSRKDQFRMIIAWMHKETYLKPESYAGQYEKVIEQLFIIGDFWIASAEILYEGKEKDKIAYYADIVNQVLVPYFTDKGLQELSKMK